MVKLMHLHPSILCSLNSCRSIFKHNNLIGIYRASLLIKNLWWKVQPYFFILENELQINRRVITKPDIGYSKACIVQHKLTWLSHNLKSLSCSKKYIWWRFAFFDLRIITKNNMMHQGEKLTMLLCFQCKMPLVWTVKCILI